MQLGIHIRNRKRPVTQGIEQLVFQIVTDAHVSTSTVGELVLALYNTGNDEAPPPKRGGLPCEAEVISC